MSFIGIYVAGPACVEDDGTDEGDEANNDRIN